ncbi:MAG: ribose-phosphate diphosphokinase [Lachnospiraceae bacterium]|nr:ribose-phosphate diphosphokinase [Lachnospiraceae bacterium]
MDKTYYFKNRTLLAPLKIIAMDNCRELVEKADRHIVTLRKQYLADHAQDDATISGREYDKDSYLVRVQCPRFSSGEAKGMILESVRGSDLFIVSDVTNNSMSFKISGRTHYMSPDDHYQDLKRIIAAASTSAHRISVIMPFLYQSRQHKRVLRESLDCALALEELSSMGVANIVTFDAHDPCVQNAIPLHDFDNYSPDYNFLHVLLSQLQDIHFCKDNMLLISPDEGAMRRAVYLANTVGLDLGMFYKRRDYTRIEDGVNPVVASEYLGPNPQGKIVLILDDIISTGFNILEAARDMKEHGAATVIICCTFGLFVAGFEKFIKAHDEGIFDYMVTTNLNYRPPIVLEQPWYLEADMSGFIGKIINTMNHNIAVSSVVDPSRMLQTVLKETE